MSLNNVNILILTINEKTQFNLIKEISTRYKYYLDIFKVKDEIDVMMYAAHFKPDILIIDVVPSIVDEFDLINIISKKTPETSIILIDRNYIDIEKSLKTNITGYLKSDDDIEEIEIAFFAALNKRFFISSSLIKNIEKNNNIINETQKKENRMEICLSLIEKNVIMQLIKGSDDKMIAENLKCSVSAVKKIIKELKLKTNQKNRIKMVLFLVFSGVIKIKYKDINL